MVGSFPPHACHHANASISALQCAPLFSLALKQNHWIIDHLRKLSFTIWIILHYFIKNVTIKRKSPKQMQNGQFSLWIFLGLRRSWDFKHLQTSSNRTAESQAFRPPISPSKPQEQRRIKRWNICAMVKSRYIMVIPPLIGNPGILAMGIETPTIGLMTIPYYMEIMGV